MKTIQEVEFWVAIKSDLSEMLTFLSDDILGSKRELISNEISPEYFLAFDEINEDPNNELIVGVF